MTIYQEVISMFVVAFLTGYGFGLVFRFSKQLLEKIGF